MTNRFNIPIILGTAREGRLSEKVARFVLNEIKKIKSISSEIIDIKNYLSSATIAPKETGELVKQVQEIINNANGLIIVMPEYNHAFPGELKIFIDKIGKQAKGKPLGLCGVSSGAIGGARAVENFINIAVYLGFQIVIPAIYFPFVENLFNEKNEINNEKITGNLKKMLDDLIDKAK
ncbi:MAG: NAD(P)H-dependent oxidoreductase [Patescibacteria group bacterium]|jgi:NAD(P)H-dependent FMN reductase